MCLLFFLETAVAAGGDAKAAAEAKSALMKKENQWFDVGIIKATSCVVSHYHLPSEAQQLNGEVKVAIFQLDSNFIILCFIIHHRCFFAGHRCCECTGPQCTKATRAGARHSLQVPSGWHQRLRSRSLQ